MRLGKFIVPEDVVLGLHQEMRCIERVYLPDIDCYECTAEYHQFDDISSSKYRVPFYDLWIVEGQITVKKHA